MKFPHCVSYQEIINSQNKKAYLDACNSCWLSTVLDGQLVNAGPFVLQEALFKNDLDLTFGDSQLWLQYYNFLTIFSALLPPHYYTLLLALPPMHHKKKKADQNMKF